ncbi:UNVERIFIED_CONTAM: hypothetical protein Sangu_2852700 [Sesamum angustifolium]|uniref:Uncharacterized protein n=1 Tax=Sesamum angustifolium TaxID=2727405 RepID=A0AAW2IPD6_9LAMI
MSDSSSDNRSKNFGRQRWPGVNGSSQLKHNPFARRWLGAGGGRGGGAGNRGARRGQGRMQGRHKKGGGKRPKVNPRAWLPRA